MILLQVQDLISASTESLNLLNNSQSSEVLNVLQSIKDSISCVVPQIKETAVNTHPNPWAIINIVIASLGLIASALAAGFSYKTANNVKRVNAETQRYLFVDLIRHLYRNKICALAIAAKMDKNMKQYPAEYHLLKLKTLPEDIHLERYNNNSKHYAKMHELSLLLRNYNTEIDVINSHLTSPLIDDEIKQKGLESLLFKPIYLINRILDVMNFIEGCDNQKNVIAIILSEHFNKLSEQKEEELKKGVEMLSNHFDEISQKDKEGKDEISEIEVIEKYLNIKKIEKWIENLSLDAGKNDVIISSGSVLSVENDRLTDSFKKLLTTGELPKELMNIIRKETNTDASDLFNAEWKAYSTLKNALITDTLIESSKIQMIAY